jgi:hypothetical protein
MGIFGAILGVLVFWSVCLGLMRFQRVNLPRKPYPRVFTCDVRDGIPYNVEYIGQGEKKGS